MINWSNSDLPEPEIAGGSRHPDWEVPWSAAPRRTWSHLGIRLVTWKTFQYISQICYGHRYICMVYIYGIYIYIIWYIYGIYILYGICIWYIYICWPYTHYPWSNYIKLDFIPMLGDGKNQWICTHSQLYHRMTINHTHSIHNVLTAALLVVARLWGESWQIHVVYQRFDCWRLALFCGMLAPQSKQMNQCNGFGATAKEGFKAEVFAGGEGSDHTWSPSGVQPKRLVPGSCVLSMLSPCLCKCVILLCP